MKPIPKFNQTFGKHYECEVLSELPHQKITRLYYPGAVVEGGRDGLLLKVVPESAEPWIGIFGFGDSSGMTEVYSCPNANRICVISRGNGYMVSSDEPTNYEEIKAYPVLGVYASIDHNLIIFHDFTDLVGYGKDGLAWRSKRLSYDGIKVDQLDGDFLFGRSWNAPTGNDISFRLDLRTGEHEGGAYFNE